MLNYYHKFLNRLSILEPLNESLQKGKSWGWGSTQQEAFDEAKKLLTSTEVLIHYDPAKLLIMFCDASPYGEAVVKSNKMPTGEDRPIAFALKTLAQAEQNYSHLEKEALVVFGVKKFYEYCFGCLFTIQTDHKALLGIKGEHKGTSITSAAWIQRWSLFLSNYQ